MKKVMIAFMLMLGMSVTTAYGANSGCNIPTDGLSSEVVKQMVDLCVKDKEKQESEKVASSPVGNIKNIGEFASVSKEFASSLGIAARELGIAANEFLASPAGVLTAIVIIWKVFAMNILGMFFIVSTMVIWMYMLRAVMTEKIETRTVKGFGNTEKEKRYRVYVNFDEISADRGCTLAIVNIVPIILIMIIVCNMIV